MGTSFFIEDFTRLVIAAARDRLTSWGVEEIADRISLERPAARGHGDLASNIAMVSSGVIGRSPRDIAQDLINVFRSDEGLKPFCESIELAGPGFINFFLSSRALSEAARDALQAGNNYGGSSIDNPQSILLEFVSANPTGPLHVGHGRYAAFGDSLKRILVFAGHDVHSEFYVNDYGLQMETFGISLAVRYAEMLGQKIEFPEDGYQGDYPVHIASLIEKEIGDEMLSEVDPEPSRKAIEFFKKRGCKLVLDEMRSLLSIFRVEFDQWFSEISLYESGAVPKALNELDKAGEIEVKDGARWLRTSRYGDDKDRVLVRGSGEPTYFASDIAYHRQKISRGYDLLINIWGADHHGYVPRMKASFEALSHDPGRLEIIIGQLVNVIEMGERKQMSKRAGTMVTLEELIDSIGVDSARFFLVDRSCDSTLDLDLEKAKLKSDENPVYYVQYAHARIHSILRHAKEDGVTSTPNTTCDTIEDPERELIMKLIEFPGIINNAASTRGPQRVTAYSRELAATFHVFYHNCPVIRATTEVASFRLNLCQLTANVIARCLDLVGVKAPTSM